LTSCQDEPSLFFLKICLRSKKFVYYIKEELALLKP